MDSLRESFCYIFHTLLHVSFCYIFVIFVSILHGKFIAMGNVIYYYINQKKGKQNQKQNNSINRKRENGTVAIYNNHEWLPIYLYFV